MSKITLVSQRSSLLVLATLFFSFSVYNIFFDTLNRQSYGEISTKNKIDAGFKIQSSSTNSIAGSQEEHNHVSDKGESDGIVRVLLYDECSGSTAAHELASKILAAHGLNIQYRKWAELDKPAENHYFKIVKQNLIDSGEKLSTDDILLESYKLLNQKAVLNNQVLFFKAYYTSAAVISKLDNSLFAAMKRQNKLDRAICRVKDCFGGGMIGEPSLLGYTIFAENGTRANLCFKRRKYPGLKLKVHFHIAILEKYLLKDIEKDKNHILNSKTLISPENVQFYEDLFAFEYTLDENIFQSSLEAWASLLTSLVYVDKDILKSVLLPLKNTRNAPSPHYEIIENMEEVMAALNLMNPPLDYFLKL